MTKLYFPDKTLKTMKELELSEATIRDVFNNGEYRKTDTGKESVSRNYHTLRLEVGALFVKGEYNRDEYRITYVWKRHRR